MGETIQLNATSENAWRTWVNEYAAREWQPDTLWPLPKSVDAGTTTMKICPSSFNVTFNLPPGAPTATEAHSLMSASVDNYLKLMFYYQETDVSVSVSHDADGTTSQAITPDDAACTAGADKMPGVRSLSSLRITVTGQDTDLQLETDDSYSLSVLESGISQIEAPTVFGAMRGLETFSQLVTSTRFLTTCNDYAGSWDPEYEKPADCGVLVYEVPRCPWAIRYATAARARCPFARPHGTRPGHHHPAL
jgi:hypothetical protein